MTKYVKRNEKIPKLFNLRLGMFILLTLMLGNISLYAQTNTIKGKVTDATSGETIPGANIVVEGTTNGTVTDFDGNYTLTVPSKATVLVVSYMGYTTQNILINGRTEINVALEPDVKALDEVVVIGYGTAKKRDLTGAVSSVNERTLKDIPVTTAAEAITGRLAGVQVTTTEGSPDAEIKIRVRGGGSITQDNSPLYIVDGFPVSSIANISPSEIQSIDVLKDASSTAIYGARGANGVIIVTTKSGKEGKISVSFNTYYGVKNISKKLGVLSPYEYVMYQYEIQPGTGTAFENYYGVYSDLEIYKSVTGNDWQEKVFGRTATQKFYNLGVTGGNETTNFNLSLSRNNEESIMLGSGYERNNVNFKIKTKISDKFSFDFNTKLYYTIIDGAGVSSGSGSTTRLRNSVKYAPTRGLREFDTNLDDDDLNNNPESASLLYDPVQSTLDEYKQQKRFSSNLNGALSWKIHKNYTFRTEWGYDFGFNNTDYVWGPSTSSSKQYGGLPIARKVEYQANSWRIANTLNYKNNKLFDGHVFDVLVGQEAVYAVGKDVTSEARYFPLDMTVDDVLANMGFGTPLPIVTREGQPNNLLSYFGRVNYTIKDKYLFTYTMRADGSSKFAKANRWGIFPSLAIAWRISEESFMSGYSETLSNLKLRTSIGSAGNNRISDGLIVMTYNTDNENKPYYPNQIEAPQLISLTLNNPALKWETTITRNIGLDFGFYKQRLSGTIDLYLNNTKDLLVESPIPLSTGYSSQMRNTGKTSNRGIELTLDAILIEKKDFSLSTSFNISFNKNRVEEFKNGDINYRTYTSRWNGSAEPSADYIVMEGKPLGQMYGYVTEGMYSFDDFTFDTNSRTWKINPGVADNSNIISPNNYYGPGALKLKDMPTVDTDGDGIPDSGDGVIDEKDKTVIGNALPIHTGGFNVTARYKSFDFSAFFNWSYGNDIYNANKLDFSSRFQSRNYQNLSDIMALSERFTTIDPATGNNIYYGANANPELLQSINEGKNVWMPLFTNVPFHSWAVEDGSFLRLNNITLGYTLPRRWTQKVSVSSMRLYVTGYNLLVLTKYTGFDPEVDTRRATPLTPGVDFSAYPKSISFIFGANINF